MIICERSPASANSSTMFSSLSSMNESRYLMMFGWFSCCTRKGGVGGHTSDALHGPSACPTHIPPIPLQCSSAHGFTETFLLFLYSFSMSQPSLGNLRILPSPGTPDRLSQCEFQYAEQVNEARVVKISSASQRGPWW